VLPLPCPQILRHFGEPQPDLLQKQKYAAWRAAEISRAVKEGRPPEPPPEARDDSAEDTAILAELAKLEMAGSSSAPAALPGGGGDGGGDAAAPLPPPPAAPSGRLSGLPPVDEDWGPPAPPLPPPPPPVAAPPGAGDDGELRLPSPPKQRPLESRPSGTVWTPPPPRRFQTFQKARHVCLQELPRRFAVASPTPFLFLSSRRVRPFAVWRPSDPQFPALVQVLFLAEDGTAPVRGTIAKVEEGAHPQHPTYLVALPGGPPPLACPPAPLQACTPAVALAAPGPLACPQPALNQLLLIPAFLPVAASRAP
jgi:vacuolar protein sorting-associated protein VTA1